MTDLINNIVKEGCIPDDWREIILVHVYKGKGNPRDAALSRTVRNIFSSLWQSVGRERLLRAASTSCLYLFQLAVLGSHRFDVGLGWRASLSVI